MEFVLNFWMNFVLKIQYNKILGTNEGRKLKNQNVGPNSEKQFRAQNFYKIGVVLPNTFSFPRNQSGFGD